MIYLVHLVLLLLSSADFFSKLTFSKILSGTLSECLSVLIWIQTVCKNVGPDLDANWKDPNCSSLQRLLLANDKSCKENNLPNCLFS